MAAEHPRINIDHLPETIRLAEEVQRTRQPRILQRGGQDVALLSPAPKAVTPRSPRGKVLRKGDALFNLIGIGAGHGKDDGATDISENKHKYLAEAYYPRRS